MAHTVIRDIAPEPDKTLFLLMDGENNLTADPKTLDSVLENRQTTEVKLMRILASSADSDEGDEDENDTRPKVKLTFEEILPENPNDESKTGDSTVPPDMVDPFSHLDTEAMQRLKKALASEQAKMILGDNVTAMLDVLSVEDPASFLRNSIKRDHCYTQLSPSSDPKGPSFVMNASPSSSKPKGAVLKVDVSKASGSGVSKQPKKSEELSDSDQEVGDSSESNLETGSSDRSSDSDYHDPNSGFRRDRRKKRAGRMSTGRGRRGRPAREKPREASPKIPETPQVESAPAPHVSGKRGRPRKETNRLSATPTKPQTVEVTTLSPVVEAIPVDNMAAKALSADAIRLGRPQGKSEEERKRDMARILEKLDGGRGRKIVVVKQAPKVAEVKPATSFADALQSNEAPEHDRLEEGEVVAAPVLPVLGKVKPVVRTYERQPSVISEAKKPVKVEGKPPAPKVEVNQPQNVMGGKYPRRENRKLPSHLADTIGPELFSSPDSLRRKEETKAKQTQKILQKTSAKKKDEISAEKPAETTSPVPVVQPAPVKLATPSAADDTLTELENMLEEGLEETKPIPVSVAQIVSDLTSENNAVETAKAPSVTVATSVPAVEAAQPVVSTVEETEKKRTVRAKRASRESAEAENAESFSSALRTRLSVESKQSESADTNFDQSIPIEDSDQKRRRSSEMSELDELDSDMDDVLSEASWNSEDDPDKLWCICRKPHNNRFMICCDSCEEWFHGKCVGITKSIGKQMEQDGLDWTCPPCTKKKRTEEKEKEMKMSGKAKPADVKPTVQTKLAFVPKRKCIMCSGVVRENSIYCSDQCIRKHSQKAIAQLDPIKAMDKPVGSSAPVTVQRQVDPRVMVINPNSNEILNGPSAPKLSNLATWLKQNPSFHVLLQKSGNSEPTVKKIWKFPSVKKVAPDGKTAGKIVVSRPGVQTLNVVNRPASGVPVSVVGKTPSGQLQLTVSPNSKHIKIVTRIDPMIKVLPSPVKVVRKPFFKEGESSSQKMKSPDTPKAIRREPVNVPVKRKRKEKLEVLDEFKTVMSSSTSRGDEPRRETAGEMAVRENVRKTLGDALKARVLEIEEKPMSNEDIDTLAVKIEDRLYSHFDNKTDVKYKSRYRSLVFNIKDPKNQTLYRKILLNSISPKQLVRLTAEELASQELAQWREKENQHNLEMIKKTELENMKINQTIIMKSHKGEEVLEKDSKALEIAAKIDPNTSVKELVSALNSVSSTTPDNDEKQEKNRNSETALMKMKKKESERSRNRHKDRHHKRSRSRSRTRHSKSSRKRSRSRSRDRHRHSRDKKSSRSSRHSTSSRSRRDSRDKDKKSSDKDKKEKEDKEVLAASTDCTTDSQVDFEKPEAMLSDEADYEPTSTVNIKTPEITAEEPEEEEAVKVEEMVDEKPNVVWQGELAMAEVTKFQAKAVLVGTDTSGITNDMSNSAFLLIVGRIPINTVWDYIVKHQMNISVVQFRSEDDENRKQYATLHNYLLKRSRMGVVELAGTLVKDFYIFAYEANSAIPTVLEPFNIPEELLGENVIFGVLVGKKQSSAGADGSVAKRAKTVTLPRLFPPSSSSSALSKSLQDVVATSAKVKTLPLPEFPPEVTRLSPSGDKQNPKRKIIKVQVALKKPDEDDSPYEPASSDEDLPPLSKVAKMTYTPKPVAKTDIQDAEQIQKKIEEMNKAIEEQTQEIQTLASTVPVLQQIPGLGSSPDEVISAVVAPVPSLDVALQALQSIVPVVEKLKANAAAKSEPVKEIPVVSIDIPMPPSPPRISEDLNTTAQDEMKMDVDISAFANPEPPSLPEIAIPSNLQEILASIQKNTEGRPAAPETTSRQTDEPGLQVPGTSGNLPSPQTPKKKIDLAEVFEVEKTKSVTAKPKQMIKFDLKLKTKDVDERVTPLVGRVDTFRDVDERSMDKRPGEDMVTGAQDQDYRRLPRPASGSAEAPSHSEDRHQWKARRRSDADSRKSRPKDKIEEEWEESIRQFEEEQRRRNEIIRDKEIERLRRRSDDE